MEINMNIVVVEGRNNKFNSALHATFHDIVHLTVIVTTRRYLVFRNVFTL